MMAPKSNIRLLLHFIAAANFWYGIYYDFNYVHIPPSIHRMGNTFGGKFKFLTFLNECIQAIYFTVAFINDLIGSNEVAPRKYPPTRKLKDYLFASLAFPVALNVAISFWSLMAIDRELVLPKALDEFLPAWLNHVMHTSIAVFIVLELFISFRKYPTRRNGLAGLIAFMLSYLIWIHIIKIYSGVWVYPILDVLNWPQRIAFYLLILGATFSLYLVGEFLNSKIWSKELKYVSGKLK